MIIMVTCEFTPSRPIFQSKNRKNCLLTRDDKMMMIRELHLSATFVRGLFGPASTKVASNKPAENRNRRLKFHSDTIEHFESYQSQQWFLIVMTSTVRTISDGSVYLKWKCFSRLLKKFTSRYLSIFDWWDQSLLCVVTLNRIFLCWMFSCIG